jgi:protein TonB
MNFSQQQADPRRHFAGISFVFLFHIFIVYALVTGLGKKVIDVIKPPVDMAIIEEIKKPPTPPEPAVPQPPELAPPKEVFVPLPEVPITPTTPVANTITATTTVAPLRTDLTPTPPVTTPAIPAPVSAAVVCSNFSAVMGDAAFPKEAIRQGIEKGDAVIQFTLGANGEVKDVRTIRASHPIFARNSIRLVGEYKCRGQGHDVLVQVPFGYKLE